MNPIVVNLALTKETKGTYRYDTEALDAPITSLYVKKGAIGAKAPAEIKITVTEA